MPVTLVDWTVPTGRIEVAAALINPDSANVLYRDDTPSIPSDTQDAGELADGTLEIAPNYYISRIISAATQQIQLHDNPNSANIGSFFAAGGAGHDLRIHAQNEDASGYFDVSSATVASANPQRVRWSNIPANFYQVISDAGTAGTPFILAFTREDPNQPPAIAITTAPATVDGRSVTTINGTVSDAEDDDGAVTVTAATTLGTVSAVTNTAGVWSFTLTAPAVAAAAQDMEVTVTAEDSGGRTATAVQAWTVRANQPPAIAITTAPATVDGRSVTTISGTVSDAEDPDNDVTVTAATTLGTVSAVTNTAGVWSFTLTAPAVAAAAQDMEVTVTAEDSHGATAAQTRTWTVRANQPPAIAITTAPATVDGRSVTTISGTVRDAEDPDNDVTVTAATTLGTVSAVTNTAGVWSFTLTAPAVAAAAQDMEVTVTAEDSHGATAAQTRTWTVRANQPPAIAFTTAPATVDGRSVTTISGTVRDAEDDAGAVTVTAATTLGTVSAVTNTAGAWSFTLTAPAVAAAAQDMEVTVTAADSTGATAAQTRTWTVRANQPPAIAITTAPTTVDSNAELALAATATPPEPGQALTIAWTATGGTFSDDSGPTASWNAPAPTLDTTYTITATATDALGAETVSTVDITVRRALVPPTAAITTPRQTVDGRTVVALQLNAATATGPLTYIWSADPPAGRFDSHTAQDPSWTAPTPSRRTDYTLSVTVRNEDGLTATAAVVITVRQTILAAADMALEVGQTLDAKLAAASTLTGPVSYSMTNLPPDASLHRHHPRTDLDAQPAGRPHRHLHCHRRSRQH